MTDRVAWVACGAWLLLAACGGTPVGDTPAPVATAESSPEAGSESGAEHETQAVAGSGLEAPPRTQPGDTSSVEVAERESETSQSTAAEGESSSAKSGNKEGVGESAAALQAGSAAGSGEEAPKEPATLATLAEVLSKPLIAGEAPLWPFRGFVQLWHGRYDLGGEQHYGWVLRYWVRESETPEHREVPLPGLEIDCLGQVALVSHGERGMEFGGGPGAVTSGFWVPWGGEAETLREPSAALLEELRLRPSDVVVRVEGDLIHVGQGSRARTYAMREPVRGDGERWKVQARHDGDLFLMTVHPAHLECMSGVSWMSHVGTGEIVACGANTAATRFVAPELPEGPLVLPDPGAISDYLSCPTRMDLYYALPLDR